MVGPAWWVREDKKMSLTIRALLASAAILLLVPGTGLADIYQEGDNLLDMSLEDLMNMEVTSVSKRAQPLHDAAAAIFVITAEDIQRLGVTTIPDALRHVPGLHVGTIDSNKWAVTSRGFNGRFSNKLLVLVDGRSIYTNSYSGVYWEAQEMLLEDLERIEIIRGPGSTLWGANAVTGVINIITKHAADTQGGLVSGGAGTYEKAFGSARYGTRIGNTTYFRAYGLTRDRDHLENGDGEPMNDAWTARKAGFRLDSEIGDSRTLMLQGEYHRQDYDQVGYLGGVIPPYIRIFDDEARHEGGHILAHWQRTYSPTSALAFQAYYSGFDRREFYLHQDDRQFDLDLQHNFQTGRHTLVWGAGYRHTKSKLHGESSAIEFEDQGSRPFALYHFFLQDEINLMDDRLALTTGSKVERNDYTGWEIQPTMRLAWHLKEKHRLWGAVSRAVRTPNRLEDDAILQSGAFAPNTDANPNPIPVLAYVVGNKDFQSEVLMAYELGYRYSEGGFSADVTGFYQKFTSLQVNRELGFEQVFAGGIPYGILNYDFVNDLEAADYGLEAALAWQARSWLLGNLSYTFIKRDEGAGPDNVRFLTVAPEHLVTLDVGLNPYHGLSLNLTGRYVDDCLARISSSAAGQWVDGYVAMDATVNWQINERWSGTVSGRNLFKSNYLEYLPESFTLPSGVEPSVYGKLQLSF